MPQRLLVVELYSFFASESDAAAMKDDLQRGSYGWREAKDTLFEAVNAEIGDKQERSSRFVPIRRSWTRSSRRARNGRGVSPRNHLQSSGGHWHRPPR